MANAFQPKFVDLVRNSTATTGTGNIVLGQPAVGYTGFAAAVQPGESFYYSIAGVDKPAECEVGRGTMQVDGTIVREPISGVKTNFTTGSKTISLVAAAEWFSQMQSGAGGGAAMVSTRAELAGLPAAAQAALLTEPGREGLFVFQTGNLSVKVAADPRQGVHVAPASDATGASGAWVRKYVALTPQMFGATNSGNAAPALQAFFDFICANRVPEARCSGDFTIASGVTIDGTASYLAGETANQTIAIDMGNCRLTATAPIQRMLTIKNIVMARIQGRPHLRGMAWLSDSFTTHSCQTGVFLDNVGQLLCDGFYLEGFGFAGVETERQPSNNNNLTITAIQTKRVGSGAPLAGRSLTANWSVRADSGAFYDVSQYSEVTVDTLPDPYVTEMSEPQILRTVLVEIAGKLHLVKSVDRATSKIRIYPRLRTATGSSGTLKWHFGASLVYRGNDSNIPSVGTVSAIAGGCAVDLGMLYGGDFGLVHAEGCGSNIRIANDPAGQVYGCTIGMVYDEGNTFRKVVIGMASVGMKIGTVVSDDPGEDVEVFAPLANPGGVEGYYPEGSMGLTEGADEGWHYRRKRFIDAADEALNFNLPRTFDKPVFVTNQFSDNANFPLVASNDTLRRQFGYDATEITVIGRGASGQPSGSITFTPPAGHSINGGAAGAALVLNSPATATRPVKISVAQTGPASWLVHPLNMEAASAVHTIKDAARSGPTAVTYTKLVDNGNVEIARVGRTWGDGNLWIENAHAGGAIYFAPVTQGSSRAAINGAGLSVTGTIVATNSIGYATGAGGAVVQATSKSTGVTVNKPAGQITTHAGSLAANAVVTFTVSNSNVAASDTININLQSGNATAGAYRYWVDKVSAGSFVIAVENRTAGALAEALVFTFALVKAVAN